MTRAEFAKGSATFLVVIVAGLLSETYLDRHLAATETDKKATSSGGAEASAPSTSVGGMRRERRLVEKLAVVERADIVAEMPRGSLAAQLPATSYAPKQHADNQHDIGNRQDVEDPRRTDDRDGNVGIPNQERDKRQHHRNHKYHERWRRKRETSATVRHAPLLFDHNEIVDGATTGTRRSGSRFFPEPSERLWIFDLTRFLDANRNPLRWKTLYPPSNCNRASRAYNPFAATSSACVPCSTILP